MPGERSTTRSRMATVAMQAVEAPGRNLPVVVWPAAAALGLLAVALVIYFRPPQQSAGPAAQARVPKAAKTSFFSSSKPVLSQTKWSYSRTGPPPRQSLPTPAQVQAYKAEMDKLVDKQKQMAASLPVPPASGKN